MTNSTKTLNVLIAMDRKIKQISRGQIFTDFLTNQEILIKLISQKRISGRINLFKIIIEICKCLCDVRDAM